MPKFDRTTHSSDCRRLSCFRSEGDAAKVVARHLVDANLAGHDSHGVMRVLQYVKRIDSGKIDPQDEERVLDEWDTGAVIDAQSVRSKLLVTTPCNLPSTKRVMQG
ncbi:MAG: Ldh family oxidoreductase [Planctomycetaceae bacterium]